MIFPQTQKVLILLPASANQEMKYDDLSAITKARAIRSMFLFHDILMKQCRYILFQLLEETVYTGLYVFFLWGRGECTCSISLSKYGVQK